MLTLLPLFYQLPVDPKNWSFLPTTILAIAFLVGIGVWAAQKLGLTRKPTEYRALAIPSGELSEARWILNISKIVQDENEKLRVLLKESLKENFDEIHKIRNALLILQGHVSDTERVVLDALRYKRD